MLGVVLSLSAALGFGAAAVFARLGLQHIGATSGTLISLMVSTVATAAIAIGLHSRGVLELSATAVLLCFLVGLLTYPVGRLLNFTSGRLAGVSRASTIVGAAPPVATGL